MNVTANRVAHVDHQPGAEAKILARLDAFTAKEWTEEHLFGISAHGYRGLAFSLRPTYELGRIWQWCVELFAPSIQGRVSSRLVCWKGAPEATLLATVGLHIRPIVLKARRYK